MVDVKGLRLSLGLSRSEFAGAVGASTALVQSWELGRRQPTGIALKVLALLQRNPKLLKELSRI
ncbi:Antitoxin igA-2 [compost metagenome]|uniref:helix-turn-helix domain-containing protein n=1 Tax=Kluyvera intermedia TaxID=61648 RepID=UPI000FA2F57C